MHEAKGYFYFLELAKANPNLKFFMPVFLVKNMVLMGLVNFHIFRAKLFSKIFLTSLVKHFEFF